MKWFSSAMLLIIAALMATFFTVDHGRAESMNVRLCTGADGGPYSIAGDMIARMAKGDPNITVTVIKDTGGTWGNIQKTALGSDCDAMIGQPDGAAYLKRQNAAAAQILKPVLDLHREYLHAICNKDSGVDDIGDLENDPVGNHYSIALGSPGSGAWLVWQNFINEDPDYGEVPISNEGGLIATSSVASGQTTCALFPAALGNADIIRADNDFGDSLVLAGVNDRDFDDAADPQGKPLYTYGSIAGEVYPHSFNYWSDPKTVTWVAKLYVNSERFTDQKALSSFIAAAARARAGIVAQFGK